MTPTAAVDTLASDLRESLARQGVAAARVLAIVERA